MVFIRCGFFNTLKYLNLNAEYADISTIQETVAANLGIPASDISVFYNGRQADSNQRIPNDSSVDVCLKLPGGKGGFGSMLRAIGAQIEKTTNREACRDLSGRRLRDINEEQRLKRWLAKKAEREAEQLRRRKERLERLKQQPKHEFHDPDYNKQRSELPERIDDALSEGLKKASSLGKKKASSAKRVGESPLKKKCLWLDDDILSDSDASDRDPSLSSDSQNGENSQTDLVASSESKEGESSESPTTQNVRNIGNSPLESTVVKVPYSAESEENVKSESLIQNATVTSNSVPEATVVDTACSSGIENEQQEIENANGDKPKVLSQEVTSESSTDMRECNETDEVSANESKKKDTERTVINESSAASENEKQTVVDSVLDLSTFESPAALENLGMEKLKTVLTDMSLKCGGTLTERAQRLWSVRGLDPKDYPRSLRAKSKKKLI